MNVHNISDRPSTTPEPRAICVGNVLIRPGKFADIPESDITPKVRSLHGSYLWIGKTLPSDLSGNSRAALRVSAPAAIPLTEEEARKVLVGMNKEDLLALCSQVSPPLVFSKPPGVAMLAILLARALFKPDVVANPESFFWLNRWTRHHGEFEEK